MSISDELSIQLYTLRELGARDRILDAVARAGYHYVEMTGSHLADAVTMRADLDARGLEGSSSHVSLAQLRDTPDAMVEACRTLGIEELYMPAVPTEDRDAPAEFWRALGQELGQLAERFAKAGIRLGYHNHHWELRAKDGERNALDLLFQAAGASPLAWQADIAWLVRGGADPEAWLERYRDRVASAHVKDLAPEGQNRDEDGWADVGAGRLDWPRLWRAAKAAGARWMVVEHDKPKDPAACARNSFDYLAKMDV